MTDILARARAILETGAPPPPMPDDEFDDVLSRARRVVEETRAAKEREDSLRDAKRAQIAAAQTGGAEQFERIESRQPSPLGSFAGGVAKDVAGPLWREPARPAPAPAAQPPAAKEDAFQREIRATPWFAEFVAEQGEEPDLDTPHYDYRAAWAAGVRPERSESDGGRYHWPSRDASGNWLKGEDHPTRWKQDFVAATGKDPDDLGLSRDDPEVKAALARLAAKRAEIASARAGGEEQWQQIQEAPQEHPLAALGNQVVRDVRNLGKAGVRAVEGVGNLARGAGEATGVALQTGGQPPPQPTGLAGLSTPDLVVPFREEPNPPAGAPPRALQGVGQLIRDIAGYGAQGEMRDVQEPAFAREEGYIPADFWEGMKKDPVRTLAINGVENLGPLAATMAATWAAGPAAGLPMAFSMEMGGAYNEAKAEGASDEEALQAAGTVGAANAALEYLPLSRIVNKLAKGVPRAEVTRVVRDALTQAAIEGGTESLQELNNILVARATYAQEQNLGWEDTKRVLQAGVIGTVLGGGVAVTTTAAAQQEVGAQAPSEGQQPQEVQDGRVREQRREPEGRQLPDREGARLDAGPDGGLGPQARAERPGEPDRGPAVVEQVAQPTPPPAATSPLPEGGGVVQQEGAYPLPGPPLPREEPTARPPRAQERTGSGLAPEAIRSWIERLGPGKPGLSYGKLDGATSIAYRDKEGRVVAGAVLNADDTATDLPFTDKSRGLLASRGAVAVMRDLTRRNVFVSEGEASSDAIRARLRMESAERAATTASDAPAPELGPDVPKPQGEASSAQRPEGTGRIPAATGVSLPEDTTKAQPTSAPAPAPQAETPPTTQEAAPTPQKAPQRVIPPERQGREGRAFTASGTEVPFRWAVVDAAELVPSHDTLLQPNAAFPVELQPRQRERAASREQIEGMAQKLEPERLGESSSAAEGAPIVGQDLVVESGNARTIAVKTAYERGKGEPYRQMIRDRADRYGIKPEALESIERPVLVRVRQGETDRARLAQEMNEPGVATMSATEKAAQDATRLTPEMLEGLQPTDAGEFNMSNSADFIRGFQQNVVPQTERGGMVDERGQLSQQGRDRIRNAVFAAAYGDAEVAGRLIEADDAAIKSLGQALFREAPRVAKLRQAFKAGDRNADLDVMPDVMAAARKLDDLRRQGARVDDYLAQGELLGAELSPEARAVLETVGGPIGRSGKKMADVLRRYQELVDAEGSPKQARLVDAGKRSTRLGLWQEAVASHERAGQGELFLPPPVQSATAQAGFVGKKPGAAQPASPNAFSRPEVEAGFRRGRLGNPEQSIRSRIAEVATRAKHAFSREMHRIPSGSKYAPFREAMRKVRTFDPTEEVSRQLGNAISPLTDEQYDLFLRKTLLDDLAVIAEAYEPGTKLPFQMTPEDLAADKPRIDDAAEADPHVKQAAKKVKEVWEKARQDYRDAAAAIGMDTDFLDRRGEAYLHHQVIEHALAEGVRQGRKVGTPKKRGFQRELRGSVGDINLNYGEAQGQVLVQLALDANMARVVKVIEDNYSITDDLKAQAKAASTKDRKVHWESLIPEDHLPWQPEEGNVFYMGKTITDRIAQRLLADPAVSITPEDIKNALVVGGKKRTMVLPKEIVETLNEIGQKRANDLPAQIFAGNRKIVGGWKKLMLLMPRRVFKYVVRNLLGDTQKTLMGNPRAIRRFKQSASEIADYIYGKSNPTPKLAEWLARGGWESGLFQQELSRTEGARRQRLKAATELGGLLEQVKDAKSLPQRYFTGVGRHVSFLEAINRYANFLEYTAQMEADPDGRPKNFGSSLASEVMALDDVHDRAYWLSNRLVGAYDQITEAGEFIRHHVVPFWSFQELNVSSTWGLYRNALTAPESALKRARKAGVVTASMTPMAAYRVAKLFGLMMGFEAFMHAWNYGFFDDEEDDLPLDVRRTPHFILGRDDDGNVLCFNRLSVFHEAREWFGIDEFGYNLMDYLDGRISGGQFLGEVASVPGHKLLNSIGPASAGGIKTIFEFATGKTTFPRPRDIHDRWDYAYRTVGMEEEFRALSKRPTPAGGYGRSWRNAFLYAAEPGASAYYDTLSNARRFLVSKGEDSEGSHSSSRTDAMREYKRAVRYGQPDVAEKYLRLYVARGGTAKGFKQSLARLEPMSYVPKKLRSEFEEWLTPDEVDKLRDAETYYEETFGPDSPGTEEALDFLGKLLAEKEADE